MFRSLLAAARKPQSRFLFCLSSCSHFPVCKFPWCEPSFQGLAWSYNLRNYMSSIIPGIYNKCLGVSAPLFFFFEILEHKVAYFRSNNGPRGIRAAVIKCCFTLNLLKRIDNSQATSTLTFIICLLKSSCMLLLTVKMSQVNSPKPCPECQLEDLWELPTLQEFYGQSMARGPIGV